MINQFQKWYIYGYLNLYYNSLSLIDPNTDYKNFKIRQTIDYLNIGVRFHGFFRFILKHIGIFESIISVMIVFGQFTKVSINYFFVKKQLQKGRSFFYRIGKDKIDELLSKTDIKNHDLIEVIILSKNGNRTEQHRCISLLTGLDFSELLESFCTSIKTIFLMREKYGKRDFLFRSYSSFFYFLVCFYFKKLDKDNTVYYTSLTDRWSFLFAHLDCNVIFLQHGLVLDLNFIKRIGTVNRAYYINEEQKNICEKILFANHPQTDYLRSMKFTSNEKLVNNGKTNVLLICNMLFWDKEQELIRVLSSNNKCNLYIKPHPSYSKEAYYKKAEEASMIILDNGDYPQVDIVISYKSTLAIEYLDNGIKTIIYDNENFGIILNGIEKFVILDKSETKMQ